MFPRSAVSQRWQQKYCGFPILFAIHIANDQSGRAGLKGSSRRHGTRLLTESLRLKSKGGLGLGLPSRRYQICRGLGGSTYSCLAMGIFLLSNLIMGLAAGFFPTNLERQKDG